MKLLIASDIHGSAHAARRLARRVEEEAPDRIVLLGDLLYHGPRNPLPRWYAPMEVADILNGWSDIIVAVRGNCDSEVDQMVLSFPCRADYALLEVDGRLMHLSHGHLPGELPRRSAPAGTGVGVPVRAHPREGARCSRGGAVRQPRQHLPSQRRPGKLRRLRGWGVRAQGS